MAEFSAYWRAIASGALSETFQYVESPMNIILAAVSFLIGIGLLFLVGDEKAAHAEVILRVAGGLVLIFALPIIFLGKLATIPVKRDIQLREIIGSLQKQAANKEHHLAVHERIGTLWAEGEDLSARMDNETAIKDVTVRKVEWTIRVERYLTEVGLLDEAVGFKTISDYAGKLNKLRRIWMRAAKRASDG